MRNISVAALAKLTQQYGIEPINIIEIEWFDGSRTTYSDRDIGDGIKGAILEISGLDEIVQISGGGQSQQISMTLDDTDGSIKELIDTTDPHLRNCWVYQWFSGLDIDEKFLIFRGVLNTPIEWNEGDRSFKFDVISKIEDVEVGFSIEEGIFPDAPDELIGVPWPLCFGTVINVPALRANAIREGIMGQGTGIHDFTLEKRIQLAERLSCPRNFVGYRVLDPTEIGHGSITLIATYVEDAACAKNVCEIKELLDLQLTEQLSFEISPIVIYGGERFPQGTSLQLNANGGILTGFFTGNVFTITSRFHPENDGSNNVVITPQQGVIESACPGTDVDLEIEDLIKQLAGVNIDQIGLSTSLASKLSFNAYNAITASQFFWAAPGTKVTLAGEDEIIYIANILPSTILRVAAYRSLNGLRQLITVPDSYYTVRQTDYTGYPGVMEIVFSKPLSTKDSATGGGWEDTIYVSLTSSVGPNTVDIVEWFITTYTDYAIDSLSFDALRTLIDNYPMHFWLRDRKNLIQVLEELAFQARCAIWLKDNTFYMKYLSLEPTADDTITLDDIEANSLNLTHTSTEDLVTKYVAEWTEDYAKEKPNKIILRHNVSKYGTHQEDYDFYAYNIHELVLKSSSYWLIKKANTWRRLTFKTAIHKLNIEVFDTVEITAPTLSPQPIKCVVEKATYNSDDNTIEFEVWTPCKSGTNFPYLFAWPADVEETDLFPTIEEQQLNLGGSGTEPNFSTIAPKGHPLNNIPTDNLFGGFQLDCNGAATEIGSVEDVDFDDPASYQGTAPGKCRSDHGRRKPTDRGDTKPSPKVPSDEGGAGGAGPSPNTDNCCAEALAVANQALAEAKQARAEAQEAQNNSDQGDDDKPSDKLKKLPKSCGNCGFQVVVSWFPTKEITAGGPQQVCVPDGVPRSETFCYGDLGTAQAAVTQFLNDSNCTGIPPCTKCTSATLVPNGTLCEGKEGQLIAWSGATETGSGDDIDGSVVDP